MPIASKRKFSEICCSVLRHPCIYLTNAVTAPALMVPCTHGDPNNVAGGQHIEGGEGGEGECCRRQIVPLMTSVSRLAEFPWGLRAAIRSVEITPSCRGSTHPHLPPLYILLHPLPCLSMSPAPFNCCLSGDSSCLYSALIHLNPVLVHSDNFPRAQIKGWLNECWAGQEPLGVPTQHP